MRVSKLIIFLLLFTLAVALFGCGGGGNNSNVPTGLTGASTGGTVGTSGSVSGSG